MHECGAGFNKSIQKNFVFKSRSMDTPLEKGIELQCRMKTV